MTDKTKEALVFWVIFIVCLTITTIFWLDIRADDVRCQERGYDGVTISDTVEEGYILCAKVVYENHRRTVKHYPIRVVDDG